MIALRIEIVNQPAFVSARWLVAPGMYEPTTTALPPIRRMGWQSRYVRWRTTYR